MLPTEFFMISNSARSGKSDRSKNEFPMGTYGPSNQSLETIIQDAGCLVIPGSL